MHSGREYSIRPQEWKLNKIGTLQSRWDYVPKLSIIRKPNFDFYINADNLVCLFFYDTYMREK